MDFGLFPVNALRCRTSAYRLTLTCTDKQRHDKHVIKTEMDHAASKQYHGRLF